MFKYILAILLASQVAAVVAMPVESKLGSRYALVVDEDSGQVLLEKRAEAIVPIASLTKLMTAMVVLDTHPDMDELISIEEPEVATKWRRRTRLPLGAWLPRRDVLQLTLMSSNNRAAASLAGAYPGGSDAFVAAVQDKLVALGMDHTTIEEPTGLSPNNRSTAADLVKMAAAAARYPEIARMSTDSHDAIDINGRSVEYRNTNRLVGQKGWDILLSKTGTTTPAGRCLIMRFQSAGRTVILVLLNARANSTRFRDAARIRRLVDRDSALLAQAAAEEPRRAALDTPAPSRQQDPLQLARVDAIR